MAPQFIPSVSAAEARECSGFHLSCTFKKLIPLTSLCLMLIRESSSVGWNLKPARSVVCSRTRSRTSSSPQPISSLSFNLHVASVYKIMSMWTIQRDWWHKANCAVESTRARHSREREEPTYRRLCSRLWNFNLHLTPAHAFDQTAVWRQGSTSCACTSLIRCNYNLFAHTHTHTHEDSVVCLMSTSSG